MNLLPDRHLLLMLTVRRKGLTNKAVIRQFEIVMPIAAYYYKALK